MRGLRLEVVAGGDTVAYGLDSWGMRKVGAGGLSSLRDGCVARQILPRVSGGRAARRGMRIEFLGRTEKRDIRLDRNRARMTPRVSWGVQGGGCLGFLVFWFTVIKIGYF